MYQSSLDRECTGLQYPSQYDGQETLLRQYSPGTLLAEPPSIYRITEPCKRSEQALLAISIQQYNQTQPHQSLQGQTPDRVFNGQGA